MLGLAVLRGTAGNLGAWTFPQGWRKSIFQLQASEFIDGPESTLTINQAV